MSLSIYNSYNYTSGPFVFKTKKLTFINNILFFNLKKSNIFTFEKKKKGCIYTVSPHCCLASSEAVLLSSYALAVVVVGMRRFCATEKAGVILY